MQASELPKEPLSFPMIGSFTKSPFDCFIQQVVSDSGLYQITSEDNLYLEIVSDTAFQPMEKSIIYDTGDLRMVSEQYHLTETIQVHRNPNIEKLHAHF